MRTAIVNGCTTLSNIETGQTKIVELSGGVGGARLARGLAAIDDVDLTVIVNVGDDTRTHGLYISPDLDTVVYTLAGEEGPHGWGRRDDTFHFNEELARFGIDNTFRLGDKDLALKVFRTFEMERGTPLSSITARAAASLGITARVVPVSDDPVGTMVELAEGWVGFQEYFVTRGHRDDVVAIRFDGAESARPAPGVLEAIRGADRVIIGPSNPPLSVWPILAIPVIREALGSHSDVVAVSPLIGGKTLKGPADRVLASLGLPAGNRGIANAYEGLIHRLVIDASDSEEAGEIGGVEVVVSDTLITESKAATRLARELVHR